jgi:hypothetical protein
VRTGDVTTIEALNNAFRACCGADFDRLPEIVRQAHIGRTRLKGQARVQHGGAVATLLANVMGLPKATSSVTMTVEGDHRQDCMIWDRRFGDRRFRSCFMRDGDGLVESMGPFRLHLRLKIADRKLHYLLDRVSIFGVPWPRLLAPSLEAWEGEAAGRYDFAVEVRLPLIGRLVRYEGQLDHAG